MVILGLLAFYVPASNASAAPVVRCVKRDGSGLGLSIAKRIVDQHEGETRVQSKEGDGTTVAFTLHLYNPIYVDNYFDGVL